MKRILLASVCLAALSMEAFSAPCTNPVGVKDQAGTIMNFNTTVDGSSNCTSNLFPGAVLTTLSVWDTGTAGATTQTVMSANSGAPAILIQLNQSSGSFSAGAITFQGTYDGTNWTAIPDAQLLNPNTLANAGTASGIYTLVTNINKPFLILTQGYQGIRINLSTAITGTGTVSPFVTLLSTNPALGALLNPLAAGTAIIGKAGVDQTTPGTTNGVAIVGVNAATALAGNGFTGTGSQRVTVASDNTPFATKIDQTTDGTTNFARTSPRIATLTTGITRPSDTTAYAANDNLSNSTSAPTAGGFTFTSACAASGGNGLIKSAVVSASAATAYQGEVWIFDQAVTAVNDNAAFTVSDSDILNLVGIIPFTTSDITAANSVSYITGLDIGYTCVGTANLRYLVKIMAGVTPASAEVLTVRLQVQN